MIKLSFVGVIENYPQLRNSATCQYFNIVFLRIDAVQGFEPPACDIPVL
jgi:hypothetical protein